MSVRSASESESLARRTCGMLASLLLLLPAVDCLTALALLSHLVAFVRSQAFAALAEQLKLVPGGLQVSPVLTEHMELFPSAEVEDGAGFELPRDRPRLQDTDAPIFFFKHLKVCAFGLCSCPLLLSRCDCDCDCDCDCGWIQQGGSLRNAVDRLSDLLPASLIPPFVTRPGGATKMYRDVMEYVKVRESVKR